MKITHLDEVSQNELDILMKIDHANVIKYFDHFELVLSRNSGQIETSICIVMEYCEVRSSQKKSLFNYVN